MSAPLRTTYSAFASPARLIFSAALLSAAVLLCTIALPAGADAAAPQTSVSMDGLTAETRKNPSGRFITEGQVEYEAPVQEVISVLSQYSGYSEWAVEGLDTPPDPSVDLIGIIKDVAYTNYPHEQFVFTYDIDLPWPFGSSDKQLRFDIEKTAAAQRLTLDLRLVDPGITLEYGALRLSARGDADHTVVSYRVAVDFTWFIRPFFNPKRFEDTMRWRVEQVLLNLAGRLADQ